MIRWLNRILAAAILGGLLAGPTLAQVPGGGPMPVPAAAAVPDTVEIALTVPDSLPQPLAVHVVQDTLVFGGLLDLVVDYPVDETIPAELGLVADGDWLVPVEPPRPGFFARLLGKKAAPAPVEVEGLPPHDGPRLVSSFRVYRRDPLRLRWREQVSPVLTVVGRAAGADKIAAIRGPRGLEWTPWRIAALLAAIIILALVARWLWRRRQSPSPLADWQPAPPAWFGLAEGLAALLAADLLARGDSRQFLDRLVALARGYVAGRYRVGAREMTGAEIRAACLGLGHDSAPVAGFAQMVDLLDQQRYNPEAPDLDFCREQVAQLFGRVERVRLESRFGSVSPADLLGAEKAWARLAADLGPGAGRVSVGTGGEVA